MDKEQKKLYDIEYRKKNKLKIAKEKHEYYLKHKDKILQYLKKYRKDNLARLMKHNTDYRHKKRLEDPNWGKTKECPLCGKMIYAVANFCESCSSKEQMRIHGNPMQGMSREKSPAWRGGRVKKSNGYIFILKSDHPNAHKTGYIQEHRFLMEEKIGRYLTKEEEVHHINFKRDDNRIENLRLFPSKSRHMKYHKLLRLLKEFNLSLESK